MALYGLGLRWSGSFLVPKRIVPLRPGMAMGPRTGAGVPLQAERPTGPSLIGW